MIAPVSIIILASIHPMPLIGTKPFRRGGFTSLRHPEAQWNKRIWDQGSEKILPSLLTPTPSSSLRPLYSFFLFLIPLLPLPSLVPPYLHPTHHHCQSVRIRLLNNRFLNPPSSCSIQPAPLPILTSAPSYSVTTELSIVKHHVVPGLPSPAACPLPPLWQGICTVCMYILPPFHLEVVHTHPPLPFSAVTASCIHKGTMQAVQAVEIAFFHLIFQNACSVMPPFLLVDLPYVSLILSPTPPLSPPNVANEK